MNFLNLIWVLWFLSEVFFNILNRSKKGGSKEMDKNSFRLIWLTIIVSISCAVFFAIYLNVPVLNSNLLKYLGLFLVLTGIIIRIVAIYTLGKFFTVKLAINQEHKLIDKGLYKYIRHPAYSGSLLSFLGLGLYFNNWLSLVIIFLPILTAFIYRIKTEENLLLTQSGLSYDEYMNHTKRLIPFIY